MEILSCSRLFYWRLSHGGRPLDVVPVMIALLLKRPPIPQTQEAIPSGIFMTRNNKLVCKFVELYFVGDSSRDSLL